MESKVVNNPASLESTRPMESSLQQTELKFRMKAFRYQLIYSLSGLILGLACVIMGMLLFLNGVGNATWTANFLGLNSNLINAIPGIILLCIGLFFVFITRYDIKQATTRSEEAQTKKPGRHN